jgi:hypothetical protein
MMAQIPFFIEAITNLIIAILAALWCWSIVTFTRWRVLYKDRKGGETDNPMSDWAIQLFVRGTALAFLIVILFLS